MSCVERMYYLIIFIGMVMRKNESVCFFYLMLKAIQLSVLSCLFFKIFTTYC